MSAPELRATMRAVLDELDAGVKASVVDTLLARATMDLRQQYWRRHAFREELARACESLGVLVSA